MSEVVMPRLSDTMEEGTIARWLKQPGDPVRRGEVIAEIETDKATMDLEAYEDGVLERIVAEEGATVPLGGPIAVIGTGTGTAPPVPSAPSPAAAPRPVAVTASSVSETAAPAPPPPEPAGPASSGPAPPGSPLARRLARSHGIDLATIPGTGPGGRVVRADVEAAIAAAGTASPPIPGSAVPAPPAEPGRAAPLGEDTEEVPLTTVRRLTAERLTQSARAPHFHLTTVVDAEALVAFHARLSEAVAADEGRITLTDVLIKACAAMLRGHPELNSSWGAQAILRHRRVNVGLAVAVPDGLVVPVVHDADRKALAEIAAEAHGLAERARAGRLSLDEITGGTFTVSNLGMYGIEHFTAVINPPQAAILAVGAIRAEPVVRDGAVVAGTTMRLTLGIDHRVLDGAGAAVCLADLRRALENPVSILL